MTPIENVYAAFLSKMLEDEWSNWTESELSQDLFELLKEAIPQFKFPRTDLTISGDYFVGELDNAEIQILATYMKCAWLNRTILTWENVKPLYEEKDFSQANLIDKFNSLLREEKVNARQMERTYYRSRKGKPYDFTKLAEQ